VSVFLATLHGPFGGEHEEFGREDPLDRYPLDRYPLGRLAPRGELVEPDTPRRPGRRRGGAT
jgi:hypothetical protein